MNENIEPAATSVGAFAERKYTARPTTGVRERVPYPVRPTPGGISAATLSWWWNDLARLTLIGLVPIAAYATLVTAGTIAMGVGVIAMIGGLTGVPSWTWVTAFTAGFAMLAFTVTVWCAAMAGVIFAADDHARGLRSFGSWSAFLQGLAGLKRLVPPMIALSFIGFVVMVLAAIPLGIITALAPHSAKDAVSFVTGLAWLGAFVWIGARLAPLAPVYLLEERPFLDGVQRAWSMTRGRTLSIVGAGVLVGAVAVVASLVLSLFAIIPILGWIVAAAGFVALFPVAHVFWFAAYAACSNEEARA
jgi:hypothetical protein